MKIYNNLNCSKCRESLCLLEEQGIEVEVINYLEIPPNKEELKGIIQKLGIQPLDLIRQKERVFQENYAGKTLTDEAWIQAMIDHPILIERPILIDEEKAIIGRPPSLILTFLKKETDASN